MNPVVGRILGCGSNSNDPSSTYPIGVSENCDWSFSRWTVGGQWGFSYRRDFVTCEDLAIPNLFLFFVMLRGGGANSAESASETHSRYLSMELNLSWLEARCSDVVGLIATSDRSCCQSRRAGSNELPRD